MRVRSSICGRKNLGQEEKDGRISRPFFGNGKPDLPHEEGLSVLPETRWLLSPLFRSL